MTDRNQIHLLVKQQNLHIHPSIQNALAFISQVEPANALRRQALLDLSGQSQRHIDHSGLERLGAVLLQRSPIFSTFLARLLLLLSKLECGRYASRRWFAVYGREQILLDRKGHFHYELNHLVGPSRIGVGSCSFPHQRALRVAVPARFNPLLDEGVFAARGSRDEGLGVGMSPAEPIRVKGAVVGNPVGMAVCLEFREVDGFGLRRGTPARLKRHAFD